MGRHLLVWDAPNIDMTLSNIIDGKPDPSTRPDLAVLAKWLVATAGPDTTVEACIFVNVPTHLTGPLRGWVLWLLETGFRVFVKPKHDDSDVDDDMVEHMLARQAEGGLDAVYVGSNDARNFLDPLLDLQEDGVKVHALGFAEHASALAQKDAINFVDLETITGLFPQPLPRLTLDNLPEGGAWFEPKGVLGG
ncbi:MAG: hypothetical protein ACI867_000649 [Glaciecola sp.]|jgi:uncharacterized protein